MIGLHFCLIIFMKNCAQAALGHCAVVVLRELLLSVGYNLGTIFKELSVYHLPLHVSSGTHYIETNIIVISGYPLRETDKSVFYAETTITVHFVSADILNEDYFFCIKAKLLCYSLSSTIGSIKWMMASVLFTATFQFKVVILRQYR